MNAPVCNISAIEQRSGQLAEQRAEKPRITTLLEIPVLDGAMSANDSQESLLQLMLDLQRHHQLRNFDHQERFGRSDPWSENMIGRLSETIAEIKHILDDARQSDSPTTVKASISVALR